MVKTAGHENSHDHRDPGLVSSFQCTCKPEQMSNKSGAPAIQRDRLACPHSLLNDVHNTASAAQNKAVQRRQQLRLPFMSVLELKQFIAGIKTTC